MPKTALKSIESDRPKRARHRLSEQLIVSEALRMLESAPLDAFTLRALAKRLDAGVMSLYTYFSSRDALLNAVADHVFSLFEPPSPTENWQALVLEWLWATQRHLERYPIAAIVITWDGRVSAAWLKTWLPVAAALKQQGVEGARLAFAMDWFSTTAMSFISSQISSQIFRTPDAVAHVTGLSAADQRVMDELWTHFPTVARRPAFEFGFRAIVRGLEEIVEAAAGQPSPTSPSGYSPWFSQPHALSASPKHA
jgi:AcrR family transcriptional regulator